MSLDIWKLSHDLCRCCHSEGEFSNLAEFCDQNVYSDMIKDLLDICILPVPGDLCKVTYTICKSCVQRLKDAFEFKRQVLACEEKFKDFYNRNAIRVHNGNYRRLDVKVETDNAFDANDKQSNIKVEEQDSPADNKDDYTNGEEFTDFDIEDVRKETLSIEDGAKKIRGNNKTKVKGKTKKLKTDEKGDTAEEIEEEERSKKASRPTAKFRISPTDYRVEGDSYNCSHCEKRYYKLSSLRFHLKSKHYKIARYFCELCQLQFMTLAPYTVHKLETHGIDERFDCKACKGMFNTKVQLRKHINNFHMLGERYKCDHCDYESFSFEGMYKHKFKHRSVKSFQCRFCMKSFLRKTTLDLHERIHTGDRRKVCKVCGQAFVQKSSLNYHMAKYHPEVNY